MTESRARSGERGGERSAARRRARSGRHVGASTPSFEGSFGALGALAYEGATVSAHVTDVETGAELLAIDDRVAMPTASVGMLLLLVEVSARLTAEGASTFGIVDKASTTPVGESGLWQHLQVPALPVVDLAALVGAANDNLATNLLLDRVGIAAVRARAESLGLRRTALLDRARDRRGPDDAPQFSIGATAELAGLIASIARGDAVDRATSDRVLEWLSLGTDLSMVASAFGLDPLAHREPDHGLSLVNTTGADAGVRCEVGVLSGARSTVAYAVTIGFDDSTIARRLSALEAMRTVGADVLEHVS